jgi:hypothetical protein
LTLSEQRQLNGAPMQPVTSSPFCDRLRHEQRAQLPAEFLIKMKIFTANRQTESGTQNRTRS